MKLKRRAIVITLFICVAILLCFLWVWKAISSPLAETSYTIKRMQFCGNRTIVLPILVQGYALNKGTSDWLNPDKTIDVIAITFDNKTNRVYESVYEGYNIVPQEELAGKLKKLSKVKSPVELVLYNYEITSDIIDQLESFSTIQAIIFNKCTLHGSISNVKFLEDHSALAFCRCSYSDTLESFLDNACIQTLALWGGTLRVQDLQRILSNESLRFIELVSVALSNEDLLAISVPHCNVHTIHIRCTFISKETLLFFASLPHLNNILVDGPEKYSKISELKSVTMPTEYGDYDYWETDSSSYISWTRITDQSASEVNMSNDFSCVDQTPENQESEEGKTQKPDDR